MQNLRAVVVGVLTALWVVAGSHCLLEEVSALSFLQCGGGADPASHCEDAACLTLEAGHYVSAAPAKAPTVVLGLVLMDVASVSEVSRPANAAGGLLNGVPPDLPKAWQFSYRAALPPRAPSIAS